MPLSRFSFIDKLLILIELELAMKTMCTALDVYEKDGEEGFHCWHIWGTFAKQTYAPHFVRGKKPTKDAKQEVPSTTASHVVDISTIETH